MVREDIEEQRKLIEKLHRKMNRGRLSGRPLPLCPIMALTLARLRKARQAQPSAQAMPSTRHGSFPTSPWNFECDRSLRNWKGCARGVTFSGVYDPSLP